MADPKGFLKVTERELPPRRPVPVRIMDWKEVYEPGDTGRAAPTGRPLHGLRHPVLPQGVPARQPDPGVERPHLARRGALGDRASARDQQLPRVHRAAVPGTVRERVRARHQPARRDDQADRGLDHRRGVRERLGRARAPGAPHRQDGRGRRLRSCRPRGRPAAHPRGAHRRRVRARRPHRRTPALRHPGLQDGEAPPRIAAAPDAGRGHAIPRRRRDRQGHLVETTCGHATTRS